MSRYIDADALKKSYGMANECSDCKTNWRDCQYTYTFTKMDFCGWIDDQPTADVIPIEWIKEQMAECIPYSIHWLSISFLLEDWERREDGNAEAVNTKN